MTSGKKFEKVIQDSWLSTGENLEVLNLTETGQARPCDNVVVGNIVLYSELKSTIHKSLNINKAFKKHQLQSLKSLNNKRKNVFGLVMIEFSNYDTMWWGTLRDLLRVLYNETTIRLIDIEGHPHTIKKKNGLYNMKGVYSKCQKIVLESL